MKGPVFIRYVGGARDGRFMHVVFNREGQPFDALPTTGAEARTDFPTVTRARWAVRELKRRGCIAVDQQWRIFPVEQLKVERAAVQYATATGGA